ncbi:MAG: VTT domain-containing protein [Candidatus Krumholzibacteriia bacterium]
MTGRGARLLLLVLLVAAAVLAAGRWGEAEARLVAAGDAGVAVYGAAFVVLAMGCFPVAVLAFTAGAVYGPWPGYPVVVAALGAAGLLMFLLGRSVLREPLRRRLRAHPRGRALEDLAAAKAVRLNVLARLSPFNFGIVSYTLAAGRTSLRAYLLGLGGTLPSLAVHVLAGTLVRSGGAALAGDRPVTALGLGATAAAVLALLLLSWQLGRIALDAWRQAADPAAPGPDRVPPKEERP